jgi:adenosylcobinamide-phosphate synthase
LSGSNVETGGGNLAAISTLAIAALLDYSLGDPWNWLHPVQVMGWIIGRYSQWVWRYLKSPLAQRIAGVGLALGMVLGTGIMGWAIALAVRLVTSQVGESWFLRGIAILIEAVLLASCLAGRSLRIAAEDVMALLATGELDQARDRLSRYVGRDTDQLSEPEILRALLETVTENATDGVMAPLFYALVGAFLPTGSMPLALAYKAASTLDSMVGYREAPYTDLGWCSARLEDLLTWLPCRLHVLTLALLSGTPLRVWQLCLRDAPKDPSPNAGWSECAYAAMLGVQVGGTNTYRGMVKHKPLLGDPVYPITPERVYQAMRFTRYSFLLWLGITLFVIAVNL